MTLNDIVEKYIALRDKKEELVAKHKAEVKQINDLLDKAEAVLLKTFHDSGLESVRTAAGTAFLDVVPRASVADWETFLKFCQDNQAFDMIEHRCKKEAIAQYLAANDDLPPGINWSEEQTVKIHRARR